MFQAPSHRQGTFGSALAILELIYHSIVRSIRASHNNAFIALGTNILQAVIFVAVFYVMFTVLGLRGAAIRGDFLLYIMSGIFLFLTHIKAISAVLTSEGPTSPMMQHAPLNTVITITAAALGSLYIQVLTMLIILFVYHVLFTPVVIHDPVGAFGMFLIAWFVGVAIGVVFLSLKPWFPEFTKIASMLYQRANMIFSGKMFVANTLPAYMLALFDWNPLFHCIDQARGYVFINYNPRYTDWHYALWVGVALLIIGLMGEFYTRRQASLSWGARR